MRSTDEKKAKVYTQIKIWGLLSFIPMILAGGPLAGYFIGHYLEKKFGFASYISLICAAIGFIGSARETIRIINLVIKIEKKS